MVLFFPLQLLGAEQSTEYPTEYPTEQPHPVKRIEMLDTPHDYLAGKYVGLASKIDRFFGDSRNFQESNTSVLQIDLTRVSGYGGNNQYVLAAKARLRLPATEGRLHLLVESDPEKNITPEEAKGQAGANKKVLNPQNKVTKPESYAAALRYEKTEESRWHNSADAGIQFSGISAPPNPFARARSPPGCTPRQSACWQMPLSAAGSSPRSAPCGPCTRTGTRPYSAAGLICPANQRTRQ